MASTSAQDIYYKYNVISNVQFFKLFLQQQMLGTIGTKDHKNLHCHMSQK